MANFSGEGFKEFTIPVLNFIARAIKDFDSAFNEFNELTSSVRLKAVKEKEAQDSAKRAEEERNKKARETAQDRFQERIKTAQAFTVKRKEYEEGLSKAMQSGLPELKSASEKTKTKIEFALKALRKMSAATEVGVSLSEYSSRLIDTKAEVDEAIDILPDNFLRQELILALQSFIDAGRAWNEMGKYDFLISGQDTFWSLVDNTD